MRIVRGLAVLVILLFAAASANAAGFRLPEAGAKAMGMAMAFTAQADDPSAIYFNPAGLVQLEGMNVMVGGTYVRENGAEFSGATPLTLGATRSETQKDLNFILPNAYWTRKASPRFAYGIGVYTPFGLGQEYKDRDAGIFRNQVNRVDIKTVVVNPTVAWKIEDVLSVGAGIDFMWGQARLNQTIPAPVPPNFPSAGYVDLKGDGIGWGYNFGVLLTPSKAVRIGFNYRSPFTLKIRDADVDFTSGPAVPPGALTLATEASTDVNMPATAALGVAYTAGRLTLEADADWTFWSKFRKLTIDFKSTPAPTIPTSVTRPENWRDVVAYRFGAEYRVTDPLALRIGFAYDPTPVPAETLSPLLPDANRLFYSVGAGYKMGRWTFDVSYMYLNKRNRTVDNINDADPSVNNMNGTWKGDAHLAALDIGYRF